MYAKYFIIYKGHNSKITSAPCNQLTLYNCRVKEECLMDSKYQTMEAVYHRRATWPEPRKVYFGLAEGKWKNRCYNHKKSFNHKRYSHETSLSSYVWHLKETLDVTLKLKWSVVRYTTLPQKFQKSALNVCMKNWLLLPIQDNTNFYINDRSYFANAIIRISIVCKTII